MSAFGFLVFFGPPRFPSRLGRSEADGEASGADWVCGGVKKLFPYFKRGPLHQIKCQQKT
jgi:hypothetical protein